MKNYQESRECLGSKLSLELVFDDFHSDFKSDVAVFWQKIENFENRFSRFRSNSELSVVNNNIGVELDVSVEMRYWLEKVEDLNRISEGYFDALVEVALSGLGYDAAYSFQEKKWERPVGRIEFLKNGKVRLPSSVDFGGFGKGYALDLAKSSFQNYPGVCLNAGGDIWVNGFDLNQKKWRCYLESPYDFSRMIGVVESSDLFLASSNSKKRAWGKYSHHLINPVDFKPAENMLAVYVQGNSGVLVDAFSTALFVMGYEIAKEFLIKNKLVEGLLISKSGQIWKSPGYQVELFLS